MLQQTVINIKFCRYSYCVDSIEINNKDFYPSSGSEIRTMTDLNASNEFLEVKIQRKNGHSLVVLLNKDSAYITMSGMSDKIFHSINFTGDKDKSEGFYLPGGERKQHSKYYLVTRKDGIDALALFFKEGKIPAEIALEEE